MHEIEAPTDALIAAAQPSLKLYESIRKMRDNPDIQLDTRRVFTCVAKFGESVLGDALAIFDEFAFPLVKQAKVGDILQFTDFSLSIASIEDGKVQAHVIDPAGSIRFQVDWNDETPFDRRGLVFREPPATEPRYHFQESFLSANPIKEDQFGIHPIGHGFLDYIDGLFHNSFLNCAPFAKGCPTGSEFPIVWLARGRQSEQLRHAWD